MRHTRLIAALALVALAGCHSHHDDPDAGPPENHPGCDWTQWGRNATHTGFTCATGQRPERALASFTFDPYVPREQAEVARNGDEGGLLAHFQAPLVVGDDVYMERKAGQYISCNPPGSHCPQAYDDGGCDPATVGLCGPDHWDTQVWSEVYLHWEGDQLKETWHYDSDWKAEPSWLMSSWEPVFQPALSGDVLYVPGAGGTVHKLDRHTGAELARLSPFGDGGAPDPSMFVSSPLTVDESGNLLYTVLALSPGDAAQTQGYLVKATAGGSISHVTFDSLVPNAPAPTAQCDLNYGFLDPVPPRPWPPQDSSGAVIPVPTAPCLHVRPAVNAAPAVGPDGTIFVIARLNGSGQYGWVVAVNPDLTPRWAASMRDLLNDGCGALVPEDVDTTGHLSDGGRPLYWRSHCPIGTPRGVDPLTGKSPAAKADDTSSSSPVALPDGSVLYGALTTYNNSRGHLLHFDSSGHFVKSFDFGWDVTPAVYPHDGTFSLVTKDNHYFSYNSTDDGPFLISRLGAGLTPEWQFRSTNNADCDRWPDGGVTCTTETCDPLEDGGSECYPSHPNGFEWCVNAPAVDASGHVFANSEDGRLYVMQPSGEELGHIFLQESLGAAYTPLSIDSRGRIYSLNGGVMTVVGQ